MSIRIRRGTDAQRLTVVLQDGEIAWTTDTQEFFVGDGVTLGGIFIGPGTVGAFVPLTRNITINGITQDLSVDRTWTIAAGVTSVNTATGAVSLLVSNTGTGGTLQWNTTTLEIPEAAATKTGLLSSTDWSTFNGKLGSTLASSNILVGNAGNVATAVAMSGEASIDNAGAVTLANSAVIGKVLTGFTPAPGTVAATDTILQAIEKLDANLNLQAASAKLFNYYNFI